MMDARELIAAFGVICIMIGSWLVSPGFGLICVGFVILGYCTHLGAEGK